MARLSHELEVVQTRLGTLGKKDETASLAAYEAAEAAAAGNAADRYAGFASGKDDAASLQALFDEAAEALADFPDELGKVVDAINKRREELEKKAAEEAKAAEDTAKRREDLDRVEVGPATSADAWTRIGAFSSAASGAQTAILKEQNAHLKAIELYTRLLSQKSQTQTVTL